MVAVEADVVDVGRHELNDGWQRLAVVADGAVADLSLGFIFIDVFEVQFVIRFRYQVAFSVGNGVHRRYEPQRRVTSPDVDVALDINIAGDAIDVVRGEVTPVAEHTFQDERVCTTRRKHSAGHTHKYAQHKDCYLLMAFHDYKITDNS